MRTQMQYYAPELHRDITLCALSAAGILAVSRVQDLRLPKDARNMALILEHLRDGVADPTIKTDKELMEFARRYPDLTARIFMMIRRLTMSLET